jgi:hypothetical protein
MPLGFANNSGPIVSLHKKQKVKKAAKPKKLVKPKRAVKTKGATKPKKTSKPKKVGKRRPAGNPTPQLPIYAIGGLRLTGDENLVIAGKTIVINGDVRIEGNATLTLRDSALRIDQSYPQQYTLSVNNTANFIIERVTAPKNVDHLWWMNWNFYDSCKVTQTDFIRPNAIWQSVWGNSTINLTRSTLNCTFNEYYTGSLVAVSPDEVWLELLLPKRAEPYVFDSIPNGQRGRNWSSPSELPYSINISNASVITSIDFDLAPGVSVVVKNSPNIRFGWAFHPPYTVDAPVDFENKNATITGLKNTYYGNQVFSSGTGDHSSTLTLINTNVVNWWPVVFDNFNLNIDDCVMADPRATDSNINVTNSVMDMYGVYGNSKVLIKNSQINKFLVVKGNSVVDLENVSFSGTITKDSTAVVRRNGIEQ